MGAFYTQWEIANIGDRSRLVSLPQMLVDTESEFTWSPKDALEGIGIEREKKDLVFVMANGQQVKRSVGFAIIRAGGGFTVDEIVFAEDGDLMLLGARTLEGLRVDPAQKKLVAAGPLSAAVATAE